MPEQRQVGPGPTAAPPAAREAPTNGDVAKSEASPSPLSQASGTETVTVACKMPNGITMRLHEMVEERRIVNGMVIEEKIARLVEAGGTNCELPGRYKLNGFSIDLHAMSTGVPPDHEIQGGYGLTYGIPRDYWERWAQTDGKDFVARNIVFAAASEQRARDKAREMKGVASGLEPIDQSNPGARTGLGRRVERGTRTAV